VRGLCNASHAAAAIPVNAPSSRSMSRFTPALGHQTMSDLRRRVGAPEHVVPELPVNPLFK
jgi:hypothetical protein